jgi:hypothetical protein
MQEKIEVQILTFVLDIQDWRSYSPQGESWGGYKPRVNGNVATLYFDLVRYGSVEVLL